MTDTLSQEAPAKPKRTMSAEHKAKLAAGRAKWNAEKSSAPAPTADAPAPVADDTLAQIERLKAELAAVKEATGYLPPEVVATLPMEECYYEFVADKKTARDEPIGEKITALDDPRWAELLAYRHQIHGQVIVERFKRAKSGEIISRETPICVPARTAGHAKSMMEARATNPTGQWY